MKLFEEQPLKLFSNLNELIDRPDQLKTWDKLNQNDLKLLTAQAPANYFEKMAYWTESGKIWHFPIDNEQGKNSFYRRKKKQNRFYNLSP